MDARLKTLIDRHNYDPERIQGLLDFFKGDVDWTLRVLQGRLKSHDDTHLKVAFKAEPAWSMAAAFRGEYDAT